MADALELVAAGLHPAARNLVKQLGVFVQDLRARIIERKESEEFAKLVQRLHARNHARRVYATPEGRRRVLEYDRRYRSRNLDRLRELERSRGIRQMSLRGELLALIRQEPGMTTRELSEQLSAKQGSVMKYGIG